ncbi:transthyretin-like protein isoform X2 [Wolffia australiana]
MGSFSEESFKACSGSERFAREMVAAGPFADYQSAIVAAREIWFNKVDVSGWLESFAAHPEIGSTSKAIPKWSQEEQSAALSTATDSVFQDLVEWNKRYKEKFGFIFIICASGRGMPEILHELKKRYSNRPIIELEVAAKEEMKIIELRLSKLFQSKIESTQQTIDQSDAHPSSIAASVIGGHLTSSGSRTVVPGRSRPPITTHVLDVAQGRPGSGIEVKLEVFNPTERNPPLNIPGYGDWVVLGSSVTDSDGRSGALMSIVDKIPPGFYRLSFNTGNYFPSGLFPWVGIVFEVKESQVTEHFHVPLLLSPFSFSTYRGS